MDDRQLVKRRRFSHDGWRRFLRDLSSIPGLADFSMDCLNRVELIVQKGSSCYELAYYHGRVDLGRPCACIMTEDLSERYIPMNDETRDVIESSAGGRSVSEGGVLSARYSVVYPVSNFTPQDLNRFIDGCREYFERVEIVNVKFLECNENAALKHIAAEVASH